MAMKTDLNSKQAHVVYTGLLGLVNVLTLLNSSDTWVVLVPKMDAPTAAIIVALASGLLGQAVQRLRDAGGEVAVPASPTAAPVAAPAPADAFHFHPATDTSFFKPADVAATPADVVVGDPRFTPESVAKYLDNPNYPLVSAQAPAPAVPAGH